MATRLETYDDKTMAEGRLASYLTQHKLAVMFSVPGVEVVPYGGNTGEEIFKDPGMENWVIAVKL